MASHDNGKIQLPATLALGHVTLKHRNTQAVVNAGAIPLFSSFLADQAPQAEGKATSEGGVAATPQTQSHTLRLRRIACKALANVVSGSPGSAEEARAWVRQDAPSWPRLLSDNVMQL